MFIINDSIEDSQQYLSDWSITVNGQQCECNKTIALQISTTIKLFYKENMDENLIFTTEIQCNQPILDSSYNSLNSMIILISKIFCGEKIICQEENMDVLLQIGKHFGIQEIIKKIEECQQYFIIISSNLKESTYFKRMIKLEKMLLYEIDETNIATKIKEKNSLIQKIPMNCFIHFVINICKRKFRISTVYANKLIIEIINNVNTIAPDTLSNFNSILLHQFVFINSYLSKKKDKFHKKEVNSLIHQIFVENLMEDFNNDMKIIQDEIKIPKELEKYFIMKDNVYEFSKQNRNPNIIRKIKDHYNYFLGYIKDDDIEEFQKYLVNSQMNIDANVSTENINQISFINDDNECSLIELSAFLGSIKCFMHLYNKKAKINKTRLSNFAVAGGNLDIIHICEREKCIFNEKTLETSIEYHKHPITKWLVKTKHITVSERILRTSILNYNIISTKYLIKKGINFEKMIIYICESNNLVLFEWLNDFLKNYNMKPIIQDNNKSALHIACEQNNVEIVKLLLLKDNMDINSKYNNKTALHIACEQNNVEIVKLLLSKDIDVNSIYEFKSESGKYYKEYKKTALHIACKQNNAEIIKLLISNDNIDINFISESENRKGLEKISLYKKTGLHIACEQNCPEIVKLLMLKENIDKNIISENSYRSSESEFYTRKTALHIACEQKNVEIVRLLLSKDNFDINSICEYEGKYSAKKTSLHIACEQDNAEIVKLLLSKANIDINSINESTSKSYYEESSIESKKTALHIACDHNNVEIVKLLLLKDNIDINFIYESKLREEKYKLYDALSYSITESKKTALHIACEKNNVEIAKLLIMNNKIEINSIYESKGIEIEEYEHFEQKTALHIACEQNNVEIVKLLLNNNKIEINSINEQTSYQLNYNLEDKEKKTALHIACLNNNVEIVKLLLSFDNIDINSKNEISGRNGYIETALHIACKKNNAEIVKLLIEKKNIDINSIYISNYIKKTALHIACKKNNSDIVKLLLSHRNININSIYKSSKNSNKIKKSALLIACEQNNVEIVKLLLKNDIIDINSIYESDRDMKKTALHFACENNNVDIVKLLLSYGIDINIKYIRNKRSKLESKKTALHIACQNNNEEIVKLLLSKDNIDINSIYENESNHSSKKTALHIACEQNNVEIVKLLISKDIDVNFIYEHASNYNEEIFFKGTFYF